MHGQDLLERIRVAEERADAAEKARAADAVEHARLLAAERERADAAAARADAAAARADAAAARADAAQERADAAQERADAAQERADTAERNTESNFKLFVESHNNEFKQPQLKCTFFIATLKRLKNVLFFWLKRMKNLEI
jgi:hypothetical protein